MPQSPSKKQPVLVSEMLKGFFLKSPFARPGSEEWFFLKAFQAWPEITKELKDLPFNRPVRYRKGHLFISVENACTLQEMKFYTEDIKNHIHNYFHKEGEKKQWVKKITLTINPDLLKQKAHLVKHIKKYQLDHKN